jgi:hypothetical protein
MEINKNSELSSLKEKYFSSLAVFSNCIKPHLELINEQINQERGSHDYDLFSLCVNERKNVEHYRKLIKEDHMI